jgi:protein SCO1/2
VQRRHVILIAACFLFGALLGVYALLLNSGPGDRVQSSGKALVGGPFALVDPTGKTVTDQDFRGRYMLIFFGFTHCPDICPAELQVMAAAMDQLGPKAAKVVPIFITLDPERDTPEAVGAYVKNFGPNIVGLTGSSEAVAAAAKAYRVSFSKFQDQDSGKNYTIDHSALAYLMGTDGEYITHIPYGTSVAQMLDILNRYL